MIKDSAVEDTVPGREGGLLDKHNSHSGRLGMHDAELERRVATYLSSSSVRYRTTTSTALALLHSSRACSKVTHRCRCDTHPSCRCVQSCMHHGVEAIKQSVLHSTIASLRPRAQPLSGMFPEIIASLKLKPSGRMALLSPAIIVGSLVDDM